MRNSKYLVVTLVCIFLGIVISLQYRSTLEIKKADALNYKRIQDVQADLIAEKEKVENLKLELQKRDETIQKYVNAAADAEGTYKILNEQLMQAQMLAGLTNVTGKGVEVRISETNLGEVRASDILEVLNVLRAAGAQAISINSERAIATTQVVDAGGDIVINDSRFRAPFIIRAIGKPDVLESSLLFRGGVVEQLKLFHLDVEIKKLDNIEIPKYNGIIPTDLLTIVD